MQILMTGSSGDLGTMLTAELPRFGYDPIGIDIRKPQATPSRFFKASILNREALKNAMQGIDAVVHIAAWHGIHESEKSAEKFWDLNVTGTFNVLEAAVQAGVSNVVYLSSTSIRDKHGLYGHTKVLGEEIIRTYHARHQMNTMILRPRAFIPHWNKKVYASFMDWAQWFWRGAVHIVDVNQAVILALNALSLTQFDEPLILNVDRDYVFTSLDLKTWDEDGTGSTFRRVYGDGYAQLAIQLGFDIAQKPSIYPIHETKNWLGYQPEYNLIELLKDFQEFGEGGPPIPAFLTKK